MGRVNRQRGGKSPLSSKKNASLQKASKYRRRSEQGILQKKASKAFSGPWGDSRDAARTNMSSGQVIIDRSRCIGEGAFRLAYSGTYLDGIRNQQAAVCKRFKTKYRVLKDDFYKNDFRIADVAIRYAQQWNDMCRHGKEILVTRGDVMEIQNQKYLVEPFIRYFEKFTANNGWIQPKENNPYAWKVQVLEAFSHYTYHMSGGQLILCDLQGRYKHNKYRRKKCRFELTDPAISSRRRSFGPTDMGEKGIETFFFHHVCNEYCHFDGNQWTKPRAPQQWFDPSRNTSMLRLSATKLLETRHPAQCKIDLEAIYEQYDEEELDGDVKEEDSIVPMKEEWE